MRTTIDLDDELLTQVKERAAQTGRTMSAVVEDAVRQALAQERRPRRGSLKLTMVGGRGTLPGVDITNNAAIQDLMDGVK